MRPFEVVQKEIADSDSSSKANLIVVSKNRTQEELNSFMTLFEKQKHFGENRVSQLQEKAMFFHEKEPKKELCWHFIGNLQSNKIKKLLEIPNLYALHSVSSVELFEKLLNKITSPLFFFLQINLCQASSKQGLSFKQAEDCLKEYQKISSQTPFKLKGLMAMGEEGDLVKTKMIFQEVKKFALLMQEKYCLDTLELSMGMSEDYLLALEIGTHWIRLGKKLFS